MARPESNWRHHHFFSDRPEERLRLFPDGLLPMSCPRLQTTTALHGKQHLSRDTAWAISQENIRRKNGGPGTILGMQSPTKSSGLRCQQARGAGPWLTPSGVPSGTRRGPFYARGPFKARLRSRDDECKLFGLAAKGLIAALLSVSIQLAGAPVVKAEPRARHVPVGEVDALSFQSKEQPGRSGVVGVKTLRRLGFTTVEPSARPNPALQEPVGSGSDPGPPSTLELITLALMLVVLAELCGGAIAERRRLTASIRRCNYP